MKRKLLLTLLLLTGYYVHAADYYWVGGGGNWSDLNHWRLGSSTGPVPSIVPSSGDNVFFDTSSGFGTTVAAKTVTLDASAFCNNMTWGNVPNSPLFVTANAAFNVQASGTLSLNPTTTYNLQISFKGATPATLTTNGTVLGEFGMEIDKPGSSLTVTDSLVVPATTNTLTTNQVTLTSGTFSISGKKVLIYQFFTNNSNVRTLDMSNTNFTANLFFQFYGLNKTLNAAGSTLNAYYYQSDGGTYNKVTATNATGPNTIVINNSTFSALTFSPAAGAIYSDIGIGNTVDTLIFNGQGSIGASNTVGSVLFGGVGSLDGTGNVIRKITCLSNFTVSGNYTNTVDSVILAANRATQFNGTFNINKYLYVSGTSCDAYTEISGDTTAGTVNFTSGAVVDISNVILTGVKATGPVTPIAVNGIDGGGNTGFTITEPTGTGATFYWVGGSGDWNDKNHWSLSSGGTGGVCVPFKYDDVVFDANSGLTGGTLTTSSSSFCNDMTWAAGVGTVTFNESATASLRVYGSAVLRPNVTMNAQIEFWGSSAATLTTNGGGLGALQFWIYKTSSGSVTLLDNWSNLASGGGIFLASGNLSMAGRTVSFYAFSSSNNLVRSLDISNATITAASRWIYTGANKSMTTTGSHLTANDIVQVNAPGSTYPWADFTYGGTDPSKFSISGTTFGQLTFTSSSATSTARISTGNIIRRLEYKGAGYMNSSNNIDSLILAGSRNYLFTGTNTINQYFKAQATPCTGLTEMRGYLGTGTFAFGNAATVLIANVYMQNMAATGAITPIAFNGADAGGNTGWTISSAAGSSRYWIGGSGDWNDPTHWSTTSGGTSGACVPTVYDDVYFDAGSNFTSASKTVTINNGNAYAHNVSWTGAANGPVWSKSASWAMEVWGDSLVLNPAATFNVSSVTVKGANASFLKGTALGNFDVTIDKPGGILTLLNNYSNNQTDFILTNGTLNASGLTLNVSSVDNNASNNVSGININNSNVTALTWRYSGTATNHTLSAANSSITVGTFTATGLQYSTVNVSGTLNTSAIISSSIINSLNFTNSSTASAVGINGGSNILGTVEYKGAGGIYGTGNVIDTLIFFPGGTYTLNAGSNTTINNAWYGSGTPCRATQIVSSSTTSNATITNNGGGADFDYVRLKRITAAGSGAPFVARSHSTDLGNNVNWNIAPYNGAAPIYGLGPDTAVFAANFPITLHTDGFFGAPSSQYTWNNNSTADTLQVAGPGTYSVSVSFPDGCAISDAITISSLPSLAITLMGFTAEAAGCQSQVQWKVTDAENFSHFVVERSADGRQFAPIADLPYTGAADYAFTDRAPENGTNYYRLKLADIDARYTYSKIASVYISCRLDEVKVYPTITSGLVQVVLPQGYDKSAVQLYNISGQQINRAIGGSGALRTISLDDLPNAIYLLHVINGNEIKTFKIRKQ